MAGPEPVGELILAISQLLQLKFGITVPEADYYTCKPMEVVDNPEEPNAFLGGPTHAPYFVLLGSAGDFVKGGYG